MFISDHELTKSDAVDGMFLAKVGKKKNHWGNVHGLKHTIKPRDLCASHRNYIIKWGE